MGRTGGQDPEGREAWRFAVEQPAKFDLAINIKTAKVLGLTIPPTQFVRTDEG
jgi:putative ABC transport system substrate-binding protein